MASRFHKLENDYQNLFGEYNIQKCKLESKTEALLILSRELEQYRSERDQYKLMADQLRERYSTLKKRVEGWGPSLLGVYDVRGFKGEREQSLVQLLCELKEQNKSLQFEVEDLKQKLGDAQGDIRLLREQMARNRAGSVDEDSVAKQFPVCDKEGLVKQLETLRHKCSMLERDLQAVLDEKEELVTARDAYRHKFERLNQQLNCMLRGDQHTVVDIDGVLMENRYLQERIKQVQEEKAMITATLSKCKTMLEKKRSRGSLRFSAISTGLAISAKQIEQLLQNNPFLEVSSSSTNSADFRNLIMTLLEALNDKTLALSHQKKANKILGNRVTELEQKVKAMEASTLWQFPDAERLTYLLRAAQSEDSQSVENFPSPQHSISSSIGIPLSKDCPSPASEHILGEQCLEATADDDQSSASEMCRNSRANSCFSDLDLLPTKEYSLKGCGSARSGSVSSCVSHVSVSRSSTPSQSPLHRRSTMHSDSEISPKRTMIRAMSSGSIPKVRSFTETSGLDIDDLPPKLQKLLVAALAEIEQQSVPISEESNSSPQVTETSTKREDPSC